MKTIEIPDGWERVPFNKDTVIQEGWKFVDQESDGSFEPTESVGHKTLFEEIVYIRPIPAPVAPEGYEIVTDKSIPKAEGWLYWSGVENEWRKPVYVDKPQSKEDVYARPIVPAAPAVRCPACGKECERNGGLVICRNSPACQLANSAFTAPFHARLRVEPEPLVCPKCGPGHVHTDAFTTGKHITHCDCGISGSGMPTRAEAESEFRKLEYRK